MFANSIPFVSWFNGVLMIGVFAFVVIALIVALLLLMNSDKKSKNT